MSDQNLTELQEKMKEAEALFLAARQEAEKAKREEEQKKRDALYLKKVLENRQKYTVWAEGIVAALKEVGYDKANFTFDGVNERDWEPRLSLDGSYTRFNNEISFAISYGGGYHSPSKAIVKVGGYGGTNYPLKKDGTFNYSKIAQKVKENEESQNARIKAEKEKRNRYEINNEIALRIRKQFGLLEYSGVVAGSSYIDKRLTVKLEFTNLTEEQAVALLDAVKSLGLKI